MVNVGKIDQIFRLFLGAFLAWLGLFAWEGLDGGILGITIALAALLPWYMVISRSCFVFRWLGIHSLSKGECERIGHPYKKPQ